MTFMRLVSLVFFSAWVFLPLRVYAVSFGITPSVFEAVVVKGELIESTVEIVRANPSTDAYLLVETRDDPDGAIILASGERLKMPLGQESVKYQFQIDTTRIGSAGQLDAGIEFKSESADGALGGNHVILSGVMKVRVDLREDSFVADGGVAASERLDSFVDEEDTQIQENSFVLRYTDEAFFFTGFIALLVCIGLWVSRKKGRYETIAFFLSVATFLISVGGWAILSGRVALHRWVDFSQMNIDLPDGQFFLLASDSGQDMFLNPTLGTPQALEGEWRYIATASDRIYVIPQTIEQRDMYEQRLFRFADSTIRPYGTQELPGLVTNVYENFWGMYAVFVGERETDGSTFWCMAEVFESSDIICDFLDQRVKQEIKGISFSFKQKQLVTIYTLDGSYQFDAWRKVIENENLQTEVPVDSFSFPRPLEVDGITGTLGFVHLDDVWVFAPGERSYAPLSPSVWLERSPSVLGENISLVDTRTFRRVHLTDVSSDQRLYWLQKGGFITNP